MVSCKWQVRSKFASRLGVLGLRLRLRLRLRLSLRLGLRLRQRLRLGFGISLRVSLRVRVSCTFARNQVDMTYVKYNISFIPVVDLAGQVMENRWTSA